VLYTEILLAMDWISADFAVVFVFRWVKMEDLQIEEGAAY
jgi:hypothetical protein